MYIFAPEIRVSEESYTNHTTETNQCDLCSAENQEIWQTLNMLSEQFCKQSMFEDSLLRISVMIHITQHLSEGDTTPVLSGYEFKGTVHSFKIFKARRDY